MASVGLPSATGTEIPTAALELTWSCTTDEKKRTATSRSKEHGLPISLQIVRRLRPGSVAPVVQHDGAQHTLCRPGGEACSEVECLLVAAGHRSSGVRSPAKVSRALIPDQRWD